MKKSCALPKSVFPVKFKVKSPVHALELARQLIRPFGHWTTGALAVEKEHVEGGNNSYEIDVKSPRAEAFCALGALRRVNTKYGDEAEVFLQQAAFELKEGFKYTDDYDGDLTEEDIFDVNDQERDKETHKRVLKMFTVAIRLAKRATTKKAA